MGQVAQFNTPGAPNAALAEAKTNPPKPTDGYDPNHPCAAHVQILDADKGLVRPSGRRKYALCGFASSSRDQIPIDDPTWEVLGLNQLYRSVKRADRWFDIHANWDQENVPGTDHEAWIRDCGIPVYMGQRHDKLPTSVRYPLERIAERHADYFTSTPAYMLALVIDEIDQLVMAEFDAMLKDGPTIDPIDAPKVVRQLYATYMIGMFGIDLIVQGEYYNEKPCCEFWIGQASARNIQVYLPAQTALCKALYRYGYEREPDAPLKLSDIDREAAQLKADLEATLRKAYTLDGALQRDAHWREIIELRLRGLVQAR